MDDQKPPMLGDKSPHPAPGAAQTTIDSSTTTVDPAKVTIHNRVEPGVAPDEKDAKAGDAPHAAEPKA